MGQYSAIAIDESSQLVLEHEHEHAHEHANDGSEHSHSHSRPHKRAEKEMRTIRRDIRSVAPLIILLTACVLVSYYAYFVSIRKEFGHSHSHSNSNSNPQDRTQDQEAYDEYDGYDGYDYIVVGAGPSGIITAVSLAQKLQKERRNLNNLNNRPDAHAHARHSHGNGKVLLLESGSRSQSSVEEMIRTARTTGSDKNKNTNKNTNTKKNTSTISMKKASDPSLLNEFDVPLLWSDCNSQGVGKKGMMQYLTTHFPIDDAIVGRAIGGSGIHNAMINVRALPNDFNSWNSPKWSADIMMPYFDKIENYDGHVEEHLNFWKKSETESKSKSSSTNSPPPPPPRGRAGPLHTTFSSCPIAASFIKSSLAANIPLASLGFNDPDVTKRLGVGLYEFNIHNGIRDSVAKAFLTPHRNYDKGIGDDKDHNMNTSKGLHLQNLEVRSDATVSKLIFDSSSPPKAIGVQYYSSSSKSGDSDEEGQVREVRLRSDGGPMRKRGQKTRSPEVILSAGAIMTPQILANSGVHEGGSVADVYGVGKNLQDHPAIAVAFELDEHLSESFSSYYDVGKGNAVDVFLGVEDYLASIEAGQRGEVVNDAHAKVYGTPGFSSGAFLISPYQNHTIPDIQLTVFPLPIEPHFVMEDVDLEAMSTAKKKMMVTVSLLTPEARNSLKLTPGDRNRSSSPLSSVDESKDEFEKLHHFQTPEIVGERVTSGDIDRLAWGVSEVRRIMSMPPLSLNVTREVYPGSQVEEITLRSFVKSNVMRNSHWCGSTKLGSEDDQQAVVDDELRVRGIRNVRIVDAGVMPYIPNGNTHSSTSVVAMRGADLIFDTDAN